MKAKTKSLQSIRDKIIKRLTLSFLAMTVLIYLVLNSIIFNKVDLLEESYAKEHVLRVMKTIEHDQKNMEEMINDWASWDDTYQYIHNHDEQYEKNNLGYSTFLNLNLDLIAFIDEKGNYVYAGQNDLENREDKEVAPIPQAFKDYIAKSPIVNNMAPGYRLQGIVVVDNRALMIAVAPILQTDGEGPVRGHVIIGQYLDQEKIASLNDQLAVDLALTPLKDKGQVKDFATQQESKSVRIQVINEDKIAGYAVLDDIYGEPVLGVTVTLARSIHAIGKNAIMITLLVLFVLFLVFFTVMISFLDHSVLRRLSRLSEEIRIIGGKRAFSRRLEPPSTEDELTAVAKDINAMLDALEDAQNQIKCNEEQLKLANENLQREIGERKQAQEDIKYVAYHDYLTELPNRVLGTKLLNRAVDRAGDTDKILAVLFLDIDWF